MKGGQENKEKKFMKGKRARLERREKEPAIAYYTSHE